MGAFDQDAQYIHLKKVKCPHILLSGWIKFLNLQRTLLRFGDLANFKENTKKIYTEYRGICSRIAPNTELAGYPATGYLAFFYRISGIRLIS